MRNDRRKLLRGVAWGSLSMCKRWQMRQDCIIWYSRRQYDNIRTTFSAVHSPLGPSFHPDIHPSIYQFIYLGIYLFICLSVHQFICPFFLHLFFSSSGVHTLTQIHIIIKSIPTEKEKIFSWLREIIAYKCTRPQNHVQIAIHKTLVLLYLMATVQYRRDRLGDWPWSVGYSRCIIQKILDWTSGKVDVQLQLRILTYCCSISRSDWRVLSHPTNTN